MTEWQDRLVELETRWSFQETTLDELNRVVAEQDRRIEALNAEVEALKGYVQTLLPLLDATDADEAPPPHY